MGISSHPKDPVTIIVTIFKNGDEYNVNPLFIEVKSMDKVVFKNYLSEKISLFFPDESLFGKKDYEIEKDSIELTVQQPTADSYPYMVYVHGYNDFVTKEAVPKIIIYDANIETA